MALYLQAEQETEVVGCGDGFISIKQTNSDGEEREIFLSLHQFQTIVNHEKHLVREALGTE